MASAVECIGKEANRWGEQAYLGQDEAAQIVYGVGEDAAQSAVAPLRAEVRRYSVRKLARTAGIDARSVTRFRSGLVTPRPVTLGRLKQGLERLRDLGLADRDQSEASGYSR